SRSERNSRSRSASRFLVCHQCMSVLRQLSLPVLYSDQEFPSQTNSLVRDHSVRNACIGSIVAARRAGRRQAATPTASSTQTAPEASAVSYGLTSKRRLFTTRA